MSGIYLIGSIVSIFLCAYLFVALLKPEWFA
jgi:K+-transporting ATPase KdpF subunit